MPKVSQRYLDEKREKILQAALKVCREKPLYEVTMKDIIRSCGISQGGIYRYFSDVDVILAEVMDRCNPAADYRREIDEIVAGSGSAADAVDHLFGFLGGYMKKGTETVGKILFELTVLTANHPERGRKIQVGMQDGRSSLYFVEKVTKVIRDGVSSGAFHPVLPQEDILSFFTIAIDGIAVDEALIDCYGVPQRGEIPFDVISLMNTLKTALLTMLNPADACEKELPNG